MISDTTTVIFIILLLLIALFFLWSFQKRQRLHLLHKLYLALTGTYSIWLLALLGMKFTPPDRLDILFVFDCITQLGPFTSVIYLCIAMVFVEGWQKLPRWTWYLYVIPVICCLVCATNPLHHLQYRTFSIVKSEVVFGPFVMVAGAYYYLCLMTSLALMIRFSMQNRSNLYLKQAVLFSIGGICPLAVSILATFSSLNLSIAATAMGYLPTLACNGLAIYQLHLLDIVPVATQQVLDLISDCYLILSDKGLVISYNRPFASVFASRYGITENRYLKNCLKEEDVSKKTAIYNMITAVDACRESQSTISYEQAATISRAGVVQKNYYVTDVSPLILNEKIVGFVIIFKDITQLKRSMQQLQDSQSRMMEQERFAFLGQMMGGLAHNLKTPIMSVSGCVAATDGLIDECLSSLDDPAVTQDDYREIYGEMRDWLQKIQESTAYMSDIISAIKGQATSVSTFDESVFTLEELIKRTTLLMRHELVSGGCTLVAEYKGTQDITLHGDINNLVQVLGNLVSNAIYAQRQVGGGCITVGLEQEGDEAKIYVKDTGPGISDSVRQRLFREMVTSKGTQGSGLGLYISNAVVHGKFNGTMWCEDNPDGGAIFGLTIPLSTRLRDPDSSGSPAT